MLLSVEETGKNQLQRIPENMEDAPVFSHCSLLRNPRPKPTGVLGIVERENLTVGSPFFGVFPSDSIPKATKNVSFFIHSSNSCKLHQRIPAIL